MFRPLVRKKKELPTEECIALLKSETRGILSVLGDDDYPYGMPINHFYNEEDGKLYFHTGKKGHRTDALQKHNKVSFCVMNQGYKKEGDWAYTVNSVIAFGKMNLIEDIDQIIDITRKLSYKFTQDSEYIENEIKQAAHRTLLLQMDIEHLCGKIVHEA